MNSITLDKDEVTAALTFDELLLWRPIVPPPKEITFDKNDYILYCVLEDGDIGSENPKYQLNEKIFVKESFYQHESGVFSYGSAPERLFREENGSVYRIESDHIAHGELDKLKKYSSAIMPESKSRILLRLKALNVVRVQLQLRQMEISFMGTLPNYQKYDELITAIQAMDIIKEEIRHDWDRRYGRKYGTWWDDNCWCYVYHFSIHSKIQPSAKERLDNAGKIPGEALGGGPLLKPLIRIKSKNYELH